MAIDSNGARMRLRRFSVLTTVCTVAIGVVTLATPAVADTALVIDLLHAIPIAAENTSPYDRANFEHWIDADSDGCDTRQEVLMAESTVPIANCPVSTGRWVSWYDGAVWTQASDVDIDHMVPLSEAWDSGAQNWSAAQRRDYANDLTIGASLAAVTDNVNQSKGDRDPAQWLPPASGAVCRYISDWIEVKYRWGLSADQAEVNTLNGLLAGSCAGSVLVVPPRASTTNTAAIQAYVRKVYLDLFQRGPDPVGLQGWTAALQQGTPYGQVANGITYSDEYRSRLIAGSYQTYLGRGPDPTGAAGWLGAMRAGATIQQMEAGFIASPEYYAKAGGTDAAWVSKLYQHVLGRGAAPTEVQAWTIALAQGGSRQQVAMGFLVSYEHLTTVVGTYYVQLLGRGIDPSGAHSWVIAIQSGTRVEAVIAGIVASQEYISKV